MSYFLPPVDGAGQTAKEGDVWTAGADTIELRESRLIFKDSDGSELDVDAERLVLGSPAASVQKFTLAYLTHNRSCRQAAYCPIAWAHHGVFDA